MYYIISNLNNQLCKFIIRQKFKLVISEDLTNIDYLCYNINAGDHLKNYCKKEINDEFIRYNYEIARHPDMIKIIKKMIVLCKNDNLLSFIYASLSINKNGIKLLKNEISNSINENRKHRIHYLGTCMNENANNIIVQLFTDETIEQLFPSLLLRNPNIIKIIKSMIKTKIKISIKIIIDFMFANFKLYDEFCIKHLKQNPKINKTHKKTYDRLCKDPMVFRINKKSYKNKIIQISKIIQ